VCRRSHIAPDIKSYFSAPACSWVACPWRVHSFCGVPHTPSYLVHGLSGPAPPTHVRAHAASTKPITLRPYPAILFFLVPQLQKRSSFVRTFDIQEQGR
jgi:hypothetical protein